MRLPYVVRTRASNEATTQSRLRPRRVVYRHSVHQLRCIASCRAWADRRTKRQKCLRSATRHAGRGACWLACGVRMSYRIGTQRNEAASPERGDLSTADHIGRVALRIRLTLIVCRACGRQSADRVTALRGGTRQMVRRRRWHRTLSPVAS